jgi:hypothetical protein
MRPWQTWLWLTVVLGVAAACGHGEPGTPQNHPVLWLLGGSATLLMLAMAAWFLTGVVRRVTRREDRDDRRDERRGGAPKD